MGCVTKHGRARIELRPGTDGQRVKIRELARELGVTSRRVIDWCRAEGIPAQNSIARLHPDAALRVREHFGSVEPTENGGPTA